VHFKDESCIEGKFGVDEGLEAPVGSGPKSVVFVWLVVCVLAGLAYKILRVRNDGILDEVFANLTIVKTKS
jgi:hypothetical protein